MCQNMMVIYIDSIIQLKAACCSHVIKYFIIILTLEAVLTIFQQCKYLISEPLSLL